MLKEENCSSLSIVRHILSEQLSPTSYRGNLPNTNFRYSIKFLLTLHPPSLTPKPLPASTYYRGVLFAIHFLYLETWGADTNQNKKDRQESGGEAPATPIVRAILPGFPDLFFIFSNLHLHATRAKHSPCYTLWKSSVWNCSSSKIRKSHTLGSYSKFQSFLTFLFLIPLHCNCAENSRN